MKFKFDEDSDYGQDVLDLVGEVNLLMDENRSYQKTDVNAILIQIKVKSEAIQRNMQGKDKASYFDGRNPE